MKKRSEIEEKYKWDLSGYFKNEDEFQKEFENLKSKLNSYDIFRGKLNNEKTILECLKFDEQISKRLEILCSYANLRACEDTGNSESQERLNQVTSLATAFSANTSFIAVEIKKNPDKLSLEKL